MTMNRIYRKHTLAAAATLAVAINAAQVLAMLAGY